MAQELKYPELQEITRERPELIGELLELQQLAEDLGGDPEAWIALALTASAMGQAHLPAPKGLEDRPWVAEF